MRLDQFNNPVFNEQDIFEAFYKGLPISSDMFVDATDDTKALEQASELKFWIPLDNYNLDIAEYDAAMQADWFMPDEYKTLDIELYIASICPEEHIQRIADELAAFKARDMLNLLRYLKYFVDTCQKENILWGVGRGSSVASYVLFLLGVHSVDSIKYNLDWQEFLR